MVNNQLSAKDGDKSGGFLDVMSKNVAKSDKKADTQNQVSGNDVKDDKAKVDNTKAQTPDDKKVTTKDNKADKDVNHFSDAKNAEATKDTSKADMANEATVVEEPAMEEAPVAMANMEEIPAEVIAIVDEALDNFASEVAKVLEEALNITEDELEDAMSTLNITFADLLNPKEVTQLMVEVADVEDSVTLVLDEDLSDALSTVRDLASKVVEETGVDAATIKDIAASANKVNESFVEIPKEMNMQMATEVEADVKIQQPVEDNVVRADIPKDVAPKMAATEEVVIDEPEADVTEEAPPEVEEPTVEPAEEPEAAPEPEIEAEPEPEPEAPAEEKPGDNLHQAADKATSDRQRRFVLGKTARRTLTSPTGVVIVNEGDVITDEVIQRANLSQMFVQLTLNVQ